MNPTPNRYTLIKFSDNLEISGGVWVAMFLLTLCIILAIQTWAWMHLTQQVASGELTKWRASAFYALWASVPTIVFLIGLFGAVGLEEWLGLALIPEPLGRANPLIVVGLLGMALLGSLCFAVRCTSLKGK